MGPCAVNLSIYPSFFTFRSSFLMFSSHSRPLLFQLFSFFFPLLNSSQIKAHKERGRRRNLQTGFFFLFCQRKQADMKSDENTVLLCNYKRSVSMSTFFLLSFSVFSGQSSFLFSLFSALIHLDLTTSSVQWNEIVQPVLLTNVACTVNRELRAKFQISALIFCKQVLY